jgi:hypothetical protein
MDRTEVQWLIEELVREQDERRGWHEEAMKAYEQRGSGISGLMMSWLVTRTIVELAIFVSLILIWRAM